MIKAAYSYLFFLRGSNSPRNIPEGSGKCNYMIIRYVPAKHLPFLSFQVYICGTLSQFGIQEHKLVVFARDKMYNIAV